MENRLSLQKRKGAFIPCPIYKLVEVNGQLAYEIDGNLILICDLRPFKRARAKEVRAKLEEFLASTPNMRDEAAAGRMTFSIADGNIYCHVTPEYFKHYSAPGSPFRMQAIDNWRKANLTPEQYAEAVKQPVKQLEGAELDAWAKAQTAESEREIAKLKHNGGRVPKAFVQVIPAGQPSGLALH